MKKNLLYRLSFLLLISLQFSCSTIKINIDDVNDTSVQASHNGHNGTYERCSICIGIRERNAQQSEASDEPQSRVPVQVGSGNEYTGNSSREGIDLIFNKPWSLIKGAKELLSIEVNEPLDSTSDCDIVILKDGTEISSKVTEIGTSEIKYKKCDHIDGPTYTVPKSDVFMIKYSNGKKDVFTDHVVEEDIEEEKDDNDNIADLSNDEKYIRGRNDAALNHVGGGWFLAGLLLGLIGLLIAAVVRPKPPSGHPLSNDASYREGYSSKARSKNMSSALMGWVIWLVILLILL